MGAESHPNRWPLLIPIRKLTNAPADSPAPTQSKVRHPAAGPVLETMGLKARRARNRATRPKGRLAKKTALQLSQSTRTPPMVGPEVSPEPITAVYRPMDLPRSRSGKLEEMMAIPLPCIPATPRPCITFPTRITGNSVAVPPTTAPAKLTPHPSRKTFFRPMISARRPTGMNMMAVVST